MFLGNSSQLAFERFTEEVETMMKSYYPDREPSLSAIPAWDWERAWRRGLTAFEAIEEFDREVMNP